MKKIMLLSSVFALFAGILSAETVEVTTTEMNAETVGSLLHAIANAPADAETTIEFNFDGETLDYTDGTGIAISGKKLILNGINKKNDKRVTIKGTKHQAGDMENTTTTTLFKISGTTEVTLNDLVITGFTGIAITVSGSGSTITTDNCLFTENIDPKNEGGNNGGVIRLGGGKAILKNSVFLKNKGAGGYGGGAICMYDAGSLRVENCSFVENTASSGGAICVNARKDKGLPEVYVVNSTFANNASANRGGALYMYTAEKTVTFAPVVVNCTFVGNVSDTDGGTVCLWANATAKPMEPVFVNNLFAESYEKPYMDNEAKNDACVFYYKGDVSGTNEMEQTVIPTCKNNLYTGVENRFFTYNGETSNKKYDFASTSIFEATEQHPMAAGDPADEHMTSTLKGDMMVAMIAENSVAKSAGIASLSGVEIPATDQLGNARPAVPSVGAVEYAIINSIRDNVAGASQVKIWNEGNRLYVKGLEGAVSVSLYDLTGKQVYRGVGSSDAAVTVNIEKGIYIVKANDLTSKIIIK